MKVNLEDLWAVQAGPSEGRVFPPSLPQGPSAFLLLPKAPR